MTIERVVCGVDGSPEGLVAVRQAAAVRDPDGELLAIAVSETTLAVHAKFEAAAWAERLRAEAEEARVAAEHALADTPGAVTRVVEGDPAETLLQTARRERASLLAVGSHGRSRAAGIVLGSVATRLVHDAPCAVLIARGGDAAQPFPGSIVVGVDGSPDSVRALEVARALGSRTGARVRALAATGGKPLHVPLDGIEPLELDERDSVTALTAAAGPGDLIVVGSRGLHGVAALGSVSERVAHVATASVLVVRPSA